MFNGVFGRLLAHLLQWPFVRFHRVQLGVVETPLDYERFLAEVVGPRLDAIEGRIGVFGCGEHTRIVLKALPGLAERIHCLTDNNAVLWHQTRFGRPLLPPEKAVRTCDAFFLSTAVFQHVIRADLKRLGFRGPVIAVDDVVPPHWFLAR
jgi:hypothetical protein